MEDRQNCKNVLEWLRRGNLKHVEICKADIAPNLKDEDGSYPLTMKVAAPEHKPRAAILSCADARVIPEQIFDAAIGELFVVRIAGNVASPEAIASLEYAVSALGVQVILVMGHEKCGAVKEAKKFVEKRSDPGSFNLTRLVSYIVPAVNNPKAHDLEDAVIRNTVVAAKGLMERSKLLQKAQRRAENPILVCSVYYSFDGTVDWPESCKCR